MNNIEIVIEKLHKTLPEIECTFLLDRLNFRYLHKNVELKPIFVTPGGKFWLQSIIAEHQNDQSNSILVADYFNPENCRELRQNRINFLDECGNIYIRCDSFLILNMGHKKAKTIPENRSSILFAKSGLRLVFNFLLDNYLINSTYRQQSEIAGIALGSVKNVMDSLISSEFLINDLSGKKLINKKILLDRWIVNYQSRLKPDLFLGRFRLLNEDDKFQFSEHGTIYHSGESGAEILTDFLLPENFECYTTLTKAEIISRFRLIPDENGNIVFYKTFWNDKLNQNTNNLAPVLLIYADLLNSNKARNIETAGLIYEKYLQAQF